MKPHSYVLDTTWRTLLRDLGVQPANVLRRARLPDDLLLQPNVRLPPADYYRLWAAIEAELPGEPIGVRLCQSVRTESFSPPLFAALCSPNLVVAAQRIAQYKRLIGPIRMDVAGGRGTVSIEMAWLAGPEPPPVSFVAMEMLFCVALARIGTREAVRPLRVTTTALPEQLAPYEAFLGTPLQRGPTHAVTFSTGDAERPFLTSNEPMWNAFEPQLRQRLADLTASASTVERVRSALLEALPSGLVSIDDVAGKLALSKRTLQRRIKSEGASFIGVLNATREELARHYLSKTRLPPAEISFLLGFSEPNSFFRAFKGWTGTTPEAVRQRSAADL